MRNFDEIIRDKLYEATNDYSSAVWKNIKGEIPIQKKSKSQFFWMTSFLIVFALMITMVQQYPNWKIQTEQLPKGEKTAELNISYSILSPNSFGSPINNEISYTAAKGQSALPSNNTYQLNNQRLDFRDRSTLTTELTEKISHFKEELNLQNNTGIANEIAIPFSFINDNDLVNTTTIQRPIASLDFVSNMKGANIATMKLVNPAKRMKGNDVHCEVLRGKQSRYYFSARHVSSYAFNTLQSKYPGADEYVSSRHISESKRYSFSDEVTLGIEYRSGFFAELGIRYDQINEKFNYLDPNAYQSSTVITIDTIYNGTDENILIDTVTTVLAGEREILNNNTIKKLSIPFSVGYELPLNRKVSLAAKAGVVVNVLSKYDGRMFDEELDVAFIGERQASNNPLFNKLVHSVSGSAFLQYQVNKNMEFLVGVNAYKNLGSISYETNPIDQKYSSLGIFVGGKYNL